MLSVKERAREANKVTLVGFFINLILTAFKLIAGIVGHSNAMIADAFHSLSDFATDIVVLVSNWLVQKPRDETHDYGHGKYETLAAALIGVALLLVAIGIFWSGLSRILKVVGGETLARPGYIALIAAILSVVIKEWLYRYTAKVGKRIDSPAVIANGWHHRSDAFSSIGATIGIGGAILLGNKWTVLDPIAGIIVSFFIGKVAIEISRESFNELLEASLSEETENEIIGFALQTPGVKDQHNIRTRKIGNNIAVDLHICVEESLSISEAHDIATEIENKIRYKYGNDSCISIHTEPYKKEEAEA